VLWGRVVRRFALALAVAALAVGGCGELAQKERELTFRVVPGDASVGSLHRRLLPTLGLALGEMFAFGRLAEACRADGRFTFFFVATPLHLEGGIGSPGNAVAIR